MTHIRRLALVGVLVASAACGSRSCGGRPQQIVFGDLGSADRIRVTRQGFDTVTTITDQAKIQHAARFIERYHDGWIKNWSGPAIAMLSFEFVQGDRYLGEYGIGTTYLTVGGLSQDVPPAKTAALALQLSLHWPPDR